MKEREVKYKEKKPWIAQILRLKFPMIVNKGIVMTWGNTIYTKEKLSDHLDIHERTHLEQQRFSKWRGLLWWIKYTLSVSFRLRQEVEAYRRQYRFFANVHKDWKKRLNFLEKIAGDLSGPIYNQAVSFNRAKELIEDPDVGCLHRDNPA